MSTNQLEAPAGAVEVPDANLEAATEVPAVDLEAATEVEAPVAASSEAPSEAEVPDPGPMVPKYRLDGVSAQNRQLRDDMATLQRQLQEQGATQAQAAQATQAVQEAAKTAPAEVAEKIRGLSAKLTEAQLDGDSDKMVALQTQLIETAMSAAYQQPMVQPEPVDTAAIVNSTLQQVELNQMARDLSAAYPILDASSKDFDAQTNEDVLEVYEGLAMRGTPPAAALAKAADLVLGAQGKALKEVPSKRGLAERLAAANAPAALSPAVGSAGDPGKVGSAMDLSQEEWESLPDSARAKFLA